MIDYKDTFTKSIFNEDSGSLEEGELCDLLEIPTRRKITRITSMLLAQICKAAITKNDTALLAYVTDIKPLSEYIDTLFKAGCVDDEDDNSVEFAFEILNKVAEKLIGSQSLEWLEFEPTLSQFSLIKKSFVSLSNPVLLSSLLQITKMSSPEIISRSRIHENFLHAANYDENDLAAAFMVGGILTDKPNLLLSQNTAPASVIANPILAGMNRSVMDDESQDEHYRSHLFIDLHNRDFYKKNPRLATLEVLIASTLDHQNLDSIFCYDDVEKYPSDSLLGLYEDNTNYTLAILSIRDYAINMNEHFSSYAKQGWSEVYLRATSELLDTYDVEDIATLVEKARIEYFTTNNHTFTLRSLFELSHLYEASAARIVVVN